jgi:hypothetical protein
MKTKSVNVETQLTPDELIQALKNISITDFAQVHSSQNALYYGEISDYSFDLKNVKYSPMSSVPSLKGEIIEGVNHCILKLEFDIQSAFQLSRTMYLSTLLPIGVILILISALVLAGTDMQWHGILFSSSFIVVALLAVVFEKSLLVSIKRKELNTFLEQIKGKIIESNKN